MSHRTHFTAPPLRSRKTSARLFAADGTPLHVNSGDWLVGGIAAAGKANSPLCSIAAPTGINANSVDAAPPEPPPPVAVAPPIALLPPVVFAPPPVAFAPPPPMFMALLP